MVKQQTTYFFKFWF